MHPELVLACECEMGGAEVPVAGILGGAVLLLALVLVYSRWWKRWYYFARPLFMCGNIVTRGTVLGPGPRGSVVLGPDGTGAWAVGPFTIRSAGAELLVSGGGARLHGRRPVRVGDRLTLRGERGVLPLPQTGRAPYREPVSRDCIDALNVSRGTPPEPTMLRWMLVIVLDFVLAASLVYLVVTA